MPYTRIKFVYNEPAMIMRANRDRYLVVGDLHIGIERNLSRRGIYVSSATEFMANKIRKIMNDFSLRKIIMLGDIKESILYPESTSTRLIKGFFSKLEDFDTIIVAGNHDAHLGEIVELPIKRELLLDGFALMHGDKKPSDRAMLSDYMITAHSHAIVRIRDENGAVYDEKVWFIAKLNRGMAHRIYKRANKDIRLIVMPAFNSLIMGTEISKFYKESANPLLRNKIFEYGGAGVYNLMGQKIDLKAAI